MSVFEVRSTPPLRSLSRRRKSDLALTIRELHEALGRERPVVDPDARTAQDMALEVMRLMRDMPE